MTVGDGVFAYWTRTLPKVKADSERQSAAWRKEAYDKAKAETPDHRYFALLRNGGELHGVGWCLCCPGKTSWRADNATQTP